MAMTQSWRALLAVAALVFFSGVPGLALAGAKQDALLLGYVGSWKGSGMLTGGDEPEKFSCRNSITDGGQGKINYQGRCAVAGLNLAIYGTIKYNDDTRRYEGTMHSNTEFEGDAIGRQRGSSIVFDFKQQKQRDGHELTIGSKLTLQRDGYTVEFDVWIADSEMKMSTSVPFERK